MEQDTHVTDVIFRVDTTKDWRGTVFALFPHECTDFDWNVLSYQHIGQHSAANYTYCIKRSRPATPAEYFSLHIELQRIGYNTKVIKKQTHKKFIASKLKLEVYR